MEEKVRDAVFGNVGTMITFRVGADDAEFLEREFAPEFTAQNLVNLPKQNIFVKLAIDGVTSRPFSAETLPPVPHITTSFRNQIIEASNLAYGTMRKVVEEKIASITEEGNKISSPARVNGNNSGFKEGVELYDAECSSCHKKMKVPFKPDPNRPAYCKSCLKKLSNKDKESSPNPAFISLNKSVKDFVPVEKGKVMEERKQKLEAKEVKPKKEINLSELQNVLKEARSHAGDKKLENQNNQTNEEQVSRGEIKPGETINF